METFNLDFMGVQRSPICNILETPFESGAKERRTPFEKVLPKWTFTHRNMNQEMTQQWLDFYRAITYGQDKFYYWDIDEYVTGSILYQYECWMVPNTMQTHTIAGVTSVRFVIEAADRVEP